MDFSTSAVHFVPPSLASTRCDGREIWVVEVPLPEKCGEGNWWQLVQGQDIPEDALEILEQGILMDWDQFGAPKEGQPAYLG